MTGTVDKGKHGGSKRRRAISKLLYFDSKHKAD
jgi:hypothetical protein